MGIPESLANYIIHYGYLAVFSLVFIQELGFPNPVPNEVILLFAGYLAYTGILNFPLILLAAISGDFIGTTILFMVFYFFGEEIIKHAPRWLPVHKIKLLEEKLSKNGGRGIFIGRLLPYLRGYASVAAGLLQIPPKKFMLAVIWSAILWSGGYVTAGRLLGKQWNKLAAQLTGWELLVLVIGLILLIFFVIPAIVKRYKKQPN